MQKAFAFRLFAFSLVLLAFSLFSCSMNPDTQTRGQTYLQGEWQQDPVPMQKQLVNYSLCHFKFDCDSFFMVIKTFSKVNYGADPCMAKGQWTEYTRGHYEQRNDTLFLRGVFCNADYTLKETTGCLRMGVYKEIFKITKNTGSLIQLSSTSGVIPITARLIKRTTCHIKPL